MRDIFKEKKQTGSKVKIIKIVDGVETEQEADYIPKGKKFVGGDVIKKAKIKNKKPKKKKKKSKFKSKDAFYKSREWSEMRYRVLRVYKAKCMCCGRTPHDNGITVHVDHIKPRSKFPELELCFDNLQILCQACNMGKSNIDNTDWRPLSNNDIYLIKQSQKMG